MVARQDFSTDRGVQAVSGTLQGMPSEPIVFTIPLPPLKAAGAPEIVPAVTHGAPVLAGAAGDGHGNGNRLPVLS